MKKQYEKPMMAIEHYELTQTIAACVTKIGFQDSNCVLKDVNATWQMKSLAVSGWFAEGHCAISPVGMDTDDKICYHTNTAASFNS